MMIMIVFFMMAGICFYLLGLLIEKDKELEEALMKIDEMRRNLKYYYKEGFNDACIQQEEIRQRYESV